MLPEPPSPTSWRIEGEVHGHSVAETMQYAAWCQDYADQQARLRAVPVDVITAGRVEPRWLGRARRWFGR